MKNCKSDEKQFCEELQELLDRYKTKLEVPTIMRNAQHIFHHTLSIKYHPELHPCVTERDCLAKFVAEGPQAKLKWMGIDELYDMKEKDEK